MCFNESKKVGLLNVMHWIKQWESSHNRELSYIGMHMEIQGKRP